jgi:phosphatidylserine decarboxylase
MVRDGYFYGIGGIVAAGLIIWLAAWPYAIPLLLLAAFCLWFFRDPERAIPTEPGAIVSPGDGKVTDVSVVTANGEKRQRISIFLSVFDVHVNRSPIAGVIRDVRYQKGKFLNAMGAHSAEENEQNIVTVQGDDRTVVFKQIAGLIARRIVFDRKVGDTVARGERIGLIKFGSRVDVLFDCDAEVKVKPGDRVRGGASLLGVLPVVQPVSAGPEREAAVWKS